MNIVRMNQAQILYLAEALTRADAEGKTVRICTGSDSVGNWVKWDAGAGWTAPYYGLDW